MNDNYNDASSKFDSSTTDSWRWKLPISILFFDSYRIGRAALRYTRCYRTAHENNWGCIWPHQIAPLLRQIQNFGEVHLVGSVYTDAKWELGIEQYIAATRMNQNRAGDQRLKSWHWHTFWIPQYTVMIP